MSNTVSNPDCGNAILPGFRFRPTDEELVSFYLRRKVQSRSLHVDIIPQLDIYKYDPWELPMTLGGNESIFFCQRDKKYRNSNRPNRVTNAGFWKATGCDRSVYGANGGPCIGLKKSLVFYRGRAAKAFKTDWMMHELRFPPKSPQGVGDTWAVCRIFKKKTAQKSSEVVIAGSCQTSGERSEMLQTISESKSTSVISPDDLLLPLFISELESSQGSLESIFQ